MVMTDSDVKLVDKKKKKKTTTKKTKKNNNNKKKKKKKKKKQTNRKVYLFSKANWEIKKACENLSDRIIFDFYLPSLQLVLGRVAAVHQP